MRFTIQTKLFLSHFAAIILISGSVGTYFYQSAIGNLTNALRSRLQNSAALISQGLKVAGLDRIHGPQDVDTPLYRESVGILRSFVKANPDIAFIYVMRKEGEKVVFVLDSDLVKPAVPGEEYRSRVPALLEGFVRPSVDREITQDRWGEFLSGYAPLKAGGGDYLVGIDMYADEVGSKLKEIHLAGLLSLTMSMILALIFSRFLSLNFTRRLQSLRSRAAAIAPGGQVAATRAEGDELAQLTQSFSEMATRLEASRLEVEVNQAALRQAHDELDQRVRERTDELVKANQQLLDEVVERKRVEARLEELSQTDSLTGILNRRAIASHLEESCRDLTDDRESFCIILVDLDHFKEINDNFGHCVGDQALKYAVERLRHGIRESDLLGRWGGEEFLIMLPRTAIMEAKGLAERLCNSLSGSRVETGGYSVAVTGSFGLSRYRCGEGLDTCLKRTDDALYEAKAQGRNRIVARET